MPDRDDHVRAAALHVTCRKKGRQITTIDALLLSTDQDFEHIARIEPLRVWKTA